MADLPFCVYSINVLLHSRKCAYVTSKLLQLQTVQLALFVVRVRFHVFPCVPLVSSWFPALLTTCASGMRQKRSALTLCVFLPSCIVLRHKTQTTRYFRLLLTHCRQYGFEPRPSSPLRYNRSLCVISSNVCLQLGHLFVLWIQMCLIQVQSAVLQSSQFDTVTATKIQPLQAIAFKFCHCVFFVKNGILRALCAHTRVVVAEESCKRYWSGNLMDLSVQIYKSKGGKKISLICYHK